MIINLNKKKNLYNFVHFARHNRDRDFYCTIDNQRKYITDTGIAKKLLKNTIKCLIFPEGGDIKGIALVWKAFGGEKKRYYLKILATNQKVADHLIRVLLWNFKQELFAKVSKNSPYLLTLKKRGFKFGGGRGKEVLLKVNRRTYGNCPNKSAE